MLRLFAPFFISLLEDTTGNNWSEVGDDAGMKTMHATYMLDHQRCQGIMTEITHTVISGGYAET
jgi:hypothetical protein